MDEFYQQCLQTLRKTTGSDPLAQCGSEINSKILSSPEEALQLADRKLHVFPFKDVESRWRRLYTDAGISKALKLILEYTKSEEQAGPEKDRLLDEIVKQLDMVLIMTGAPLREDLVNRIFQRLEDYVSKAKEEETGLPPAKRQKRSDEFDTTKYKAPKIEFPVSRSGLSLSQFERLLKAPKPYVIENALQHWPAMEERPWKSPSYLLRKTFGGRRLVPVELGRSYTDEGWGQKIMRFQDFMSDYILDPKGFGIAYLAQHDLFAQVPSLRNDVAIPDFCYTEPPGPEEKDPLYAKDIKKLEKPLLNAWFGPQGTISPLHTDPYHNILCQVVGKKYVRLYSPAETAKLYPRDIEDGGIDMSNTSQVPPEKVEMDLEIDDEEFPLFRGALYVETILHEGDSIYIPVGWWHYIRALTVSFNVSFWWN